MADFSGAMNTIFHQIYITVRDLLLDMSGMMISEPIRLEEGLKWPGEHRRSTTNLSPYQSLHSSSK